MKTHLALLLIAGYAAAADDARATAEFTQRVQEFAKVRDAAIQKAGAIPKAATPEEIQAREQRMLAEIRLARKDAKQGDIFTPQIEPLFRRILKDNFKGPDKGQSRAVARQGNPRDEKEPGEKAPLIAVNAMYPKSASLSSVPPLLLLELPKLPKDLEYRFVGQTLILWDNVSNIIVDFMKGAAPGV